MNSLLNLGRCLGDVSTPAFQRFYQYQLVQSLEHYDGISFRYPKPSQIDNYDNSIQKPLLADVAHQSGTNCLAIDAQTSQFLVTGGADSTIRLWDLESASGPNSADSSHTYEPVATLSRSNPVAHSHALTSVSVYPFDPTPSTLISTSYDKTILLSAITPTSLQAVHKSSLDFIPHVHAISPHASSSPLVAIGTTHPAIRLFDLRSGLSTHSLPGHNGAVYALTFLPSSSNEHIVISGAVDGRILLFDIRRANPAFASLDLNDAIGFPTSPFAKPNESRSSHLHLDFGAQAHTGPVTGLTSTSDGLHLVSAGHDSRIRIWDLTAGRNELVHFGPRIRNTRNGHLSPLLLPNGFGKVRKEVLLWPNDDARGQIFLQSMREGTLTKVLQTQQIDRSNTMKKGVNTNKGNSRGRIMALALRHGGEQVAGGKGIELYSAHSNGSICVWKPSHPVNQDMEVSNSGAQEHSGLMIDQFTDGFPAEPPLSDIDQRQKKRKRDLINDLVEGLTKKPVTFS